MRKKKRNSRRLQLTIPAIKKLRDMIERGEIGKGMIDSGERYNAGSVKVRYVLKKRPWIITIEAKRHGH